MANRRHGERDSRDSSELIHETRKIADQAAETGRALGNAAERTGRVGAEAIQRNAENTKETWQESTETASRIAQRSMEQLSKMFGLRAETASETVQQSSGNLQAVMESTSIIAGGLQEVTSEWMRFAQRRFQQNLDHLDQLGACRNLSDYLALQTQIARDNLEAFLQSAHRTSERSSQIARAAADSMRSPSTAPR